MYILKWTILLFDVKAILKFQPVRNNFFRMKKSPDGRFLKLEIILSFFDRRNVTRELIH